MRELTSDLTVQRPSTDRKTRALDERIPALGELQILQIGHAIRDTRAQLDPLPEWLSVIFFFSSTACTLLPGMPSFPFSVRDYDTDLVRTHQSFFAPYKEKMFNYVQHVPLGVVAQITVRSPDQQFIAMYTYPN
jgi:hypothetical protein